jgi:hypothetical protein
MNRLTIAAALLALAAFGCGEERSQTSAAELHQTLDEAAGAVAALDDLVNSSGDLDEWIRRLDDVPYDEQYDSLMKRYQAEIENAEAIGPDEKRDLEKKREAVKQAYADVARAAEDLPLEATASDSAK